MAFEIRISGKTVETLESLRVAFLKARHDYRAQMDDQAEFDNAVCHGMRDTVGMRLSYRLGPDAVVEIVNVGEVQ